MRKLSIVAGVGVSFLAAGTALAQPGSLAVVRVGATGVTAPLTSAAAPVFIDHFGATTLGQAAPSLTWALPTTTTGAQRRLTISGSQVAEGGLQLSSNGQYLVLGGYDASVGTAAGTGAGLLNNAGTPRVVARIDSSGAIDTSTVYGNGEFSGGAGTGLRGVYSADGSSFYGVGNGTGTLPATSGGIRRVAFGTVTSAGFPSTLISPGASGTGTANVRRAIAFNGQLFASTNSSPFTGVNSVGTGVPVTSGNAQTNLFGTGGSSYDFFFASTTVAYLTDTRAIANGGGLQRWNFDGSAWTLAYTINLGLEPTTGLSGLTGMNLPGGGVYLAGVSADGRRLVTTTDNLSNVSASVSFSVLATAPDNTFFRGVAIPAPGAAVAMVLGSLVASRRRRVV